MNDAKNQEKRAPGDTSEADSSVNWSADTWFAKHHAADLTDEFKAWWINLYDSPDEYDRSEEAGDLSEQFSWTLIRPLRQAPFACLKLIIISFLSIIR